MSAVAKAKPDGLLGLSVFEARALLLGIFCEDGGKVDFEKLALKYPYKNSASASTSYRNARRKLAELVDSMATDGAAPAASAASPGGATGSSTATNTPKKRTPAQRKKAAAADSETAADDATGSPKPKRQRKSPVKKATPAKSKKLVEEDGDKTKADADVDDSKGFLDQTMQYTSLLLKHDGESDDLGSLDLDAELDALDTPKTSDKAVSDEA